MYTYINMLALRVRITGVCVTGVPASVTDRNTPRNTITGHNHRNGHCNGFRKFVVYWL